MDFRHACLHTSSVLQSETAFVHLVLLHFAAFEVMHRADGVHLARRDSSEKLLIINTMLWTYLLHEGRRTISPLFTVDDIKVIVCCMASSVPLRANRRAEDDQVLRDTRVDHIHAATDQSVSQVTATNASLNKTTRKLTPWPRPHC